MKLRVGLALAFALCMALPVAGAGFWFAQDHDARAVQRAGEVAERLREPAREHTEAAIDRVTRDVREEATRLERVVAAAPPDADRETTLRSALVRQGVSGTRRDLVARGGEFLAGGSFDALPSEERRLLAGDCALAPASDATLWFMCGQTLGGGELVVAYVDAAELRLAVEDPSLRVGFVFPDDAGAALGTESTRTTLRELPSLDGRRAELALHSDPVGAFEVGRQVRAYALVLSGSLVFVGLLIGVLVGSLLVRPLRELESAAARIGKGDLGVTLSSAPGGASATYSAFNRMARELEHAHTRARRAERVAAWRDIARRIAHEIKNPLTPIRMSIETMRRTHARQHPDFEEIFDESTRTVLEEVERMERIVTEFSQFARLPRPKASEIDVRELATQVVALHSPGGDATITDTSPRTPIKLTLSEGLPHVRADRDQLTQVLLNLVQNAAQAAEAHRGESGHVEVVVEPGELGVRVVVQDDGPGIPLEERARVFEPYYTTKAGGTGLGLAIVDRIISEHGGNIRVTESRWGGARFVIELRPEGPIDDPEASATT